MTPENDPNDDKSCDGLDDDCDSAVDDGFNVGTPCVGKGADEPLPCDPCVGLRASEICHADGKDSDGDGPVDVDITPNCFNPEQVDNDGVPDACDNSKGYNPSQADSDFDGVGDKTDNAPNCFNPEQVDNDGDGYPAACGDSNDNDASVNPDALDAPCDGEDKNGDGDACYDTCPTLDKKEE